MLLPQRINSTTDFPYTQLITVRQIHKGANYRLTTQ